MLLFMLISMFMMNFTEVEETAIKQLKMEIVIYQRQLVIYPMTTFERQELKKKIMHIKNQPLYVRYKICTKRMPVQIKEITS